MKGGLDCKQGLAEGLSSQALIRLYFFLVPIRGQSHQLRRKIRRTCSGSRRQLSSRVQSTIPPTICTTQTTTENSVIKSDLMELRLSRSSNATQGLISQVSITSLRKCYRHSPSDRCRSTLQVTSLVSLK